MDFGVAGRDFNIIHRKGALNQVPAALSRMNEDDGGTIAAFETIEDQWYLKRRDLVRQFPHRSPGWKIEDDHLYRHRSDPLLLSIVGNEDGWKLVVSGEY